MKNLLDRLLRLGPADEDPDDSLDPVTKLPTDLLTDHAAVLQEVERVLSDSQRRVADAFDETSRAIEDARGN